jgi:GGDEF domain-containing protein
MKNKHEKLGIRDDIVQFLGNEKDYLLFLLSIDKLNQINKFYGETKGDMILDIAVKRLLEEFTGYEICTRTRCKNRGRICILQGNI